MNLRRELSLYARAASDRKVWRRTVKLGLVVGFIQVAVNQGDHWLRWEITPSLILKSIGATFVAFAVIFISSVTTQVENHRHTHHYENL